MAKMHSKSLISISLTDFIDFVSKSGSAKLTKVKQVKNRDEYHPATDFYKSLREGIIEIHKAGGSKSELDVLLFGLTDAKKKKNYPDAIAGYKKFWAKKKFAWFQPPTKHWKVGDVDININPELGLSYDNKFLAIKLYMKSDKLSKDKVTQILSLMESQLRKDAADNVLFCVLDVKNSKLFCNDTRDISYLPLFEGEVKSFEIIWKGV
jgi:hypothetical protein